MMNLHLLPGINIPRGLALTCNWRSGEHELIPSLISFLAKSNSNKKVLSLLNY